MVVDDANNRCNLRPPRSLARAAPTKIIHKMETIRIEISQGDVYEEVAKATDYTGAKLENADGATRDRILAADADLADLGRFWDESELAVNEHLKELLVSGKSVQEADGKIYTAEIEVSRAFDKTLTAGVQSALRSFFIAYIIGQWFKFANKGEADDYFAQSAEMITAAERLLYSRRRPQRPID